MEPIIPMEYYLVVSSIMFFAGIYGFITRKNLIAILISVELVLTSTDINYRGSDCHHHKHLPQPQECGNP